MAEKAMFKIGQTDGLQSVEAQREIAEVQGKMFIARKFPRNEQEAKEKILKECENIELAEAATYEYERGKTKIKDASIRLVEVMARNWTNIVYGMKELERNEDFTIVKVFAWDLESNVTSSKEITVPHEIKAYEKIKKLTDPRDIYENTANNAMRRLRACLLHLMPSYIKDAALEVCAKTIQDNNERNPESRLEKAFDSFAEIGVSKEMIEKKLGKPVTQIKPADITRLSRLYMTIKDNFISVEEAFNISGKTKLEEMLAKEQADESLSEPAPAAQPPPSVGLGLTDESEQADESEEPDMAEKEAILIVDIVQEKITAGVNRAAILNCFITAGITKYNLTDCLTTPIMKISADKRYILKSQLMMVSA